MRPPASNESSPQSPEPSALKPPLSSALSSLNVYLEEELARYRRQRQGRPIPPEKNSKTIQPRRKPLDLIAVKAENSSRSPASTPSPQPPEVVKPPPPPNPFLSQAELSASGESESGESESGESPPPAAALAAASNQSDKSAGALAVTTKSTDPGTDAASVLATHPHEQAAPDDYLESSEELIKSLADRLTLKHGADQTAQARPGKLATPVTVGSFLLLLVASAGLGYVFTNPPAVGHLFRRFRSDTHTANEPIESTHSADGLTGGGTFRPLGPDLSNQEFIDLNLDTLSTLPGNSNRVESQIPALTDLSPTAGPPTGANGQAEPNSVTATPNSVNPAPTAQPSVAAASPSYSATAPTAVTPRPIASAPPTAPLPPAASAVAPAPVSRPSPPSVVAAPPAPAAPPPIVTAPPAAVTAQPPTAVTASADLAPTTIPRYRVVTPYTGDPSLDRVRGVVADAFVRESQIQAGAFADETAAQARVQELQAQGIQAQVYAD